MLLPFEDQQSKLRNTRIWCEDIGGTRRSQTGFVLLVGSSWGCLEGWRRSWGWWWEVDAEVGTPGGFVLAAGYSRRFLEHVLPRFQLCRTTRLARWQLGNSLVPRLFLVDPVPRASLPLHVAATAPSARIGELDSPFPCLCSAKYVQRNR